MTSKNEKIWIAIRESTEDEQIHRIIERDPGGNFLNWRDEYGMRGTISLAVRTCRTCEALKIPLKLEAEEMVVMTDMSK
jgi:hypothetical protein